MKLETQSSYIANPQFTGGVAVTPTGSSAFNVFNKAVMSIV